MPPFRLSNETGPVLAPASPLAGDVAFWRASGGKNRV